MNKKAQRQAEAQQVDIGVKTFYWMDQDMQMHQHATPSKIKDTKWKPTQLQAARAAKSEMYDKYIAINNKVTGIINKLKRA